MRWWRIIEDEMEFVSHHELSDEAKKVIEDSRKELIEYIIEEYTKDY
jgi:hypothetical protein